MAIDELCGYAKSDRGARIARMMKQETVHYKTALKLIEALNLDPVDFGL